MKIKTTFAKPVKHILAISFLITAILPIGFVATNLYDAAWQNAWREVNEKHRLLAVNLASPLSVHVRSHQEMLALLVHRIEALASGSGETSPATRHLLHDALATFQGFQTMAIVDHKEETTAFAARTTPRAAQALLTSPESCIFRSRSDGTPSFSGIMRGVLSGGPTIQMCYPIALDSNAIDILVAELDLGLLENLRQNIFFGKGGHAAIVDQYGRVIAHPNRTWMNEMKDLSHWSIVKDMQEGISDVTEFFSPFVGEDMVAGYALVPETQWGVMVPQPKSEVESQVNTLMVSHLSWNVMGLCLAILFSATIALWITRPIDRLALASSNLIRNRFAGTIPDSSRFAPLEVQQLTGAIQSLTLGFQEKKQEYNTLNEQLKKRVDDATQQLRESNVHLERMATQDTLTKLPNRRALQTIVESEHARAKRHHRTYSLLVCDLDRFKLINDNYGHTAGDEVLKALANLAADHLRDGDYLGRWGGEEFLCILADTDQNEAFQIADRLRERFATTLRLSDNMEVPTSISIGIATYPADGTCIDTLLSCADAALYEAKRAGRNRVASSQGPASGVFSIAGQIQTALDKGRLCAAYQPIVELASGEIVAEETLARILTEDNRVLEAGSFIEAASQLQLVHRIDFELISRAVTQPRVSNNGRQLTRFINISTDLLRHPKLVARLLEQFSFYCDDLRATECVIPLVVEITEREFIGNTKQARNLLAPFLDLGLSLALDDFGSGYSSFRYLADLPIKFLKIEGELVKRAVNERKVRSILKAIHDSTKDFGIITLAECVENEATYDLLRNIGIDLGQGHYFGHPIIQSLDNQDRQSRPARRLELIK